MKTNIRLKTDFISKLFLLTVLLALFQMSLSAQQKSLSAQQWKELHTGVTEDLYDVCCIDTSTVFACGQNGVILKTIDGGENWEEKYRQPGCKMTKMCFVNPQVGYVFCDSNISIYSHTWSLLKTEDGGETWQRIGTPQNSSFVVLDDWYATINQYVCSEMAIKGTDTIFVAISHDGLYRSLDGGDSFEKKPIEDFNGSEVQGFYFEDNTGYLLWCNRRHHTAGIAKTEDGGDTWRRIDSDIGITCYMINFAHFQDKNNLRIFGGFDEGTYGFTMLDTHDGFQTFFMNDVVASFYWCFGLEEEYLKCNFTDSNHGMALYVGKDMVDFWDISYTKDNGSSWTSYSHGYPNYPDRLYGIDGIDTVFFISGENGHVAKNQAFVLLDTDEQAASSLNVYPNPMIDRLFIKCEEESNVTIFSVTGEKLYDKKLVSEAIDVSHLEPGLYLIQITNHQGISYIQKLIKHF
jgi:photosystem II stability/assembly factor-like uncharacterized protein